MSPANQPTTTKKHHSIRSKFLLSLSITVLFLLMIEGIATLFVNSELTQYLILDSTVQSQQSHERDFDLLFRNKPDADYYMENRFGRTRAVINSQGFRDYRDIAVEKAPDEFRIMCVGDSSTFGLFVNQDENYPAQLQMLLNQRKTKWHYNVINAGCAGYSSFNAMRLIEKYAPILKPDVIILSVGANDFSRKSQGITDKDRDNRTGPLAFIRRIIFPTNTYIWLSDIVKRLRTNNSIDEKAGARVIPEDYRNNLIDCVKLAEETGSKLVFCPISVPIPYKNVMKREADDFHLPYLDTDISLYRAYQALIAGADSYEDIKMGEIVDLDTHKIEGLRSPEFEVGYQMRTKSFVMEDVAHPNPIGYRAIAEDLAALIP